MLVLFLVEQIYVGITLRFGHHATSTQDIYS